MPEDYPSPSTSLQINSQQSTSIRESAATILPSTTISSFSSSPSIDNQSSLVLTPSVTIPSSLVEENQLKPLNSILEPIISVTATSSLSTSSASSSSTSTITATLCSIDSSTPPLPQSLFSATLFSHSSSKKLASPPMYSSCSTTITSTTTSNILREDGQETTKEESEQLESVAKEATSTVTIASSDCSPSSSSISSSTPSILIIPTALSPPPKQHQKSPINLLELPTEILQDILCELTQPRNFVRSCKSILQLSKSTSLRARYLWLQHGPGHVLTRKIVELHRLTSSILTAPVVLLLMAMGATYRDSEEFIFRWACSKGHQDLVLQLLKKSEQPAIDLGFRSDWFLREAAKNSRQAIVKILLAQEYYTPSENGLNKAFEAAYEQSSCDTVKALLDYAEARGEKLEQESPQLFHSIVPITRRAKRVLAGGLSIQKDADKALRYAVRGNDIEMVQLLMDYGADVHAFNEEPVLVAAQKGHVEILRMLILAGADIETKAGAPLRQASESGHTEAVRILCESGADTMWSGCNALRNAASQGFDQIVAILLDHGANVNIHEGTPLQLACKHGHEAVVRVLLRYGANHRLDDGAAYKLALEANNETIQLLLIQAETSMRAKERELERILQQQGPMWLPQQGWYPSHARTFSDSHASTATLASLAATLATSPSLPGSSSNTFISPMGTVAGAPGTGAGAGMSNSIGQGVGAGATNIGVDYLSRGHKRYYSQMSNPLSVADLFRSGSVCGLVALDDEIRARQRSESNRL